MDMIARSQGAAFIVGGRCFKSVGDGLIHLLALGNASSGAFATARKSNTTAGYQVPVGKKLRITAIRVIGTAAPDVLLATSTADAGFSAAALTGAVYMFGSSAGSGGFGGPANTNHELAVNWVVAAGLYPSINIKAGGDCKCELFGQLEDA